LATSGVITAASAVSFSAPALVSSGVVVAAAKTVELGSTIPANLTAAVVETLTVDALAAPLTLASYTTLKTAVINGKVLTTVPMPTGAMGALTTTVANAALTSVTVGGTLEAVNLVNNAALTSVTTSGVVNTFVLDNCDLVAGVTLGHTHYVGGPGSTVTVQNNAILASLTTSTDQMAALTVSTNALLATMNFVSYVTKTVSGNPTIQISGNKLSGNYTNAIAATITTPYIEATITSTTLTTLKAYVALYTNPTLAIDLDLVTLNSVAGNALLSARMVADTDGKAAWVATGGTAGSNVNSLTLGTAGVNDLAATPASAGITVKVEMAHVL